jgi:phenylalanyl-tRNA synthetase beta chain
MDMAEILESHEKGVEFAFLLDGFERYPLIIDIEDKVLSFPPVINSNLTTVTEDTKNIFIDVTGTELGLCTNVLNLMATAMVEMGAVLQTVDVKSSDGLMKTPDLSSKMKVLNVSYANQILGLNLKPDQMKESFERMRFDAVVKDGEIDIEIPAYRSDILHPIDLVEDLAIGYGYDNFEFRVPKVLTFGKRMHTTEFIDSIRGFMVGLGFQEVDTLMLRKEIESDETRLLNPLTEDQSALRSSMTPSLLDVLRTNKRHELPQKVFQVGDVVAGSRTFKVLGGAIIHSKASFTEIKSYVESLLRPMEYDIKAMKHPYFISGRCAAVFMDGEEIGIFGEVHPNLMTDYELAYPVVAFELSIEKVQRGNG